MTSNLLRVSEVAERLGQNEKTIRLKIAAGLIPAIRIGDGPRSPFRIPADELEEWLYRASVPPPALMGGAVPQSPPSRPEADV